MAGVSTKDEYQDFHLHAEYRTPYKPELPVAHPDRGNSGFYLLKRYEVQIMDCFALPYNKQHWSAEKFVMPAPTSCNASIYKLAAPKLNLSLPALAWQSIDIHFTAARFIESRKIQNARLTVFHNGIKVHDDIELLTGTGQQGKKPELAKGPIYIQNHHNPVQYRNLWLVNN
ncbi:MAG: 3-keto-disaccharide hydrolase [Thalassotalea sp.]